MGLEALIRWDHPERGVVEPSEFLWLAEETGLITRIGEWVLRQSCLQARAWRVRNGRPLRVTVNLSARQHRDPGLVDLVERVLTETRTEPGRALPRDHRERRRGRRRERDRHAATA